MKAIFAYVLEFMLTFDKMQNTTSFMCTKFEIWGQIMLCPQISNWELSEIHAYWYIILHAYMWVTGISLYYKDEKICKNRDKGELAKAI